MLATIIEPFSCLAKFVVELLAVVIDNIIPDVVFSS